MFGIGTMVYNHKSKVIVSEVHISSYMDGIDFSGVEALCFGLQLAMKLVYLLLLVQSDTLCVVKSVLGQVSTRTELFQLIIDSQHLLMLKSDFRISHVSRIYNQIVDVLVKFTL